MKFDKNSYPEVLLLVMTIHALIRPDLVGAALFIGSLLYVLVSRAIEHSAESTDLLELVKNHQERIEELEDTYIISTSRISTLEKSQEQINKVASDTKRLVSESNIANVFVPRAKRREGV